MQKDRQTDISTENKKVERNSDGSVRVRKKNELQKFADSIVSEDVADIKQYVKSEVVIPAIKKTISDIVGGVFDIIRNSVDTALFGETQYSRNRGSYSRTPYNSYYDGRSSSKREYDARRQSVFDYETLEYEYRGKAEYVLNELRNDIKEYNFASVFDLYDHSELDAPTTSSNYGWTDLSRAQIRFKPRFGEKNGGVYVIELPRAIPRK